MKLLTSLGLVALMTSACITTDSSLLVENRSDFEIHEMYVTPTASPTWGPNLLNDVLFPGEAVFVGVECGTYDAMLVDETGAICEVNAVELCYEDADWILTNRSCHLFEERAAAKAAADAAAK